MFAVLSYVVYIVAEAVPCFAAEIDVTEFASVVELSAVLVSTGIFRESEALSEAYRAALVACIVAAVCAVVYISVVYVISYIFCIAVRV